MAKMGFPLETYLFNPPFISAPIESIKEERVRHGIRIVGSVLNAGLSAVMNYHNKHNTSIQDDHDKDNFDVLSAWFPYLFVNPADHICSRYFGYFEHRKNMEEIGAGRIGKLATTNSVESILLGAIRKDSEPYDLLPSAYVIINLPPSPDFNALTASNSGGILTSITVP